MEGRSVHMANINYNIVQSIGAWYHSCIVSEHIEGPFIRNHAAAAAPKKPTSVSLAEPLLAEAKALGINVSQAAEEGLASSAVSQYGRRLSRRSIS